MRRGRGRPCRCGPRAEPKRGDARIARAAQAAGRCGQPLEPKEPMPHNGAVVSDDVVQAIPTGPGLRKVEVPAPPEGPRACRCEFTKPAPGIATAAHIAAAVPAASSPVVRVHLEPNPAGWSGGRKGEGEGEKEGKREGRHDYFGARVGRKWEVVRRAPAAGRHNAKARRRLYGGPRSAQLHASARHWRRCGLVRTSWRHPSIEAQ